MLYPCQDKKSWIYLSFKEMVKSNLKTIHMSTLVQLDILYLEDLLRHIERKEVPENKIEQLKHIIRYAKVTKARLQKHCEVCALTKRIRLLEKKLDKQVR